LPPQSSLLPYTSLFLSSDLSYLPFSCTGVVHAFSKLHLYLFTRSQKVSLFILFLFNSSYTQSGYFLFFLIAFLRCSSNNLLSVLDRKSTRLNSSHVSI